MRVLLGAAMVAGASASYADMKAEYVTAAAAATPAGLTWPTEVTDVAIAAYDTVVETETAKVVAALDKQTDGKATPDFTAAGAAIKAIKTECEKVQALWATATGTGGSTADATAEQWTAFATNMQTAAVALAAKVRGKCSVTGSDPVTYYDDAGKSEDSTLCAAADKGAGADTAGTWVAATDNAKAADHAKAIADEIATGKQCTFVKGGADLASHQFWNERVLTADELEGLFPTPPATSTTDTSAVADGSASGTSPAYALAAGAAAVLALLL